ncbi:MAG: Stp1/IreP family PP2C-type Ser/Thr phosphatase [Sphingobacteriales bacterium]|nr:MAG: Stp1/IreP family PP2C-type Ser/Thr phosphatase [Sphingobacteriales bacterium]
MQLSFGNHTSIGHVRTANEDAFGNWLTPNGHLFVVCDGMGGHIGGAIASQSAVATIYQTMAAQPYPSAPVAIRHCLEQANKKLHTIVQGNPSLQGMGTTAVVVLVQGDTAFYGHIGDSRLYLYREGSLRRLTKDHSFVQSLVDQGHITAVEAEKHPRKNEIYRALGISETIDPTISQAAINLQPGDSLILCTDGVNGMIGDAAIASVLGETRLSTQQQAEKLVQLADKAGGHDNATVQIIQPQQKPVPAAVPPIATSAPVTTAASFPDEPVIDAPASKRPILPIVGGVVLFIALLLVVFSYFRETNAPKLGMEPTDTSTAVVPPPVIDTPMTQAPVPDPVPTPVATPSTKPPTKPAATDTAATSATPPATRVVTPATTTSAKPKTDTAARKTSAPDKAVAPKATTPSKPAVSKPAASPTPAAASPKPKTDTAKTRRAKAVMPESNPAP